MSNHVVAKNNGFRCLHCGAGVTLGMPVKIEDFVDASRAFGKRHARCRKPEEGDPCQFCFGFGHDFMACETVDTPMIWLDCGDTGSSSVAICRAYLGLGGDTHYPWDPDDFGRCYRLTKRFPETVLGVESLGRKSRVWKQMHIAWPAMVTMYEQCDAHLYELMRHLTNEEQRRLRRDG